MRYTVYGVREKKTLCVLAGFNSHDYSMDIFRHTFSSSGSFRRLDSYFISSFYWVLMVRSIIDDICYEYPQIVGIIPDKTLCLLVMAEFCITKIFFIPIILLSYYLQNKFLFKEIVEKEKNRVKKFVLLFTAVNTLGIVKMMIFNVAVMLIGYHCALG